MKSLQKTFDILEYVVLQNGEPVTPTRAAEALSINTATCTRIMGELVKRSYLVQISRREGYIPGPMIPALGTRHNSYEMLTAAARAPIERLSERLGCQVNFSVLHAGHRIMLCYHLGRRSLKPWAHFVFSDHWETATGRLLTAALDEREARRLTAAAGIHPFPRKELLEIRRTHSVRFRQDRLEVMGHLIEFPGYPAAAFGFGVLPDRADEAFGQSAETSAEIIEILNQPNQSF